MTTTCSNIVVNGRGITGKNDEMKDTSVLTACNTPFTLVNVLTSCARTTIIIIITHIYTQQKQRPLAIACESRAPRNETYETRRAQEAVWCRQT